MLDLVMKTASVIGFLLLVSAYLANQRGRIHATSTVYLTMNGVGALLLAVYSAYIREWVFVGLEGFWCLASIAAFRSRGPG